MRRGFFLFFSDGRERRNVDAFLGERATAWVFHRRRQIFPSDGIFLMSAAHIHVWSQILLYSLEVFTGPDVYREARGAAKRDVLRRKIFGPRQIPDTDDRFPEICLALNTDCL